MIEDLEKWFSDPKHGTDRQDMDLVFAHVEFLPRLKEYLDQPDAIEIKRVEVISALLEILEHECPRDGGASASRLADDIRATIRKHADIALRAMLDVDLIKEVVLRSILGLSIPPEYPQRAIDRAHEEGA